MKKILIGLVGEKASGKGSAAAYLEKTYGASTHTFSTPMKDCVKRLGLEMTRKNLITFSEITRKAYGQDLYARVVAKDALEDPAETVVVDGIRRPEDIVGLAEHPSFHLIYITAPLELRYERAKKRGEKGEGKMTLEEFTAQESAPTEVGIPELGSKAEYRIENAGTYEAFHAEIDRVMKSITQSP